jgi:hypothetical protein
MDVKRQVYLQTESMARANVLAYVAAIEGVCIVTGHDMRT